MIAEAFKHISVYKFYQRVGMTYRTFKHGGHQEVKFKDLPPQMQEGIIDLILALYRVQKMIYSYDIDYVCHCLKDCGVKLRPFYKDCHVGMKFYETRSLARDREEKLIRIRLELLRMLNRLFEYVLE